MADEKTAAPENTAIQAAPALKPAEMLPVRLVNGDGLVQTVTDAATLDAFKKLGYTPASTIKQQELKEKYSSWFYKGVAAAASFTETFLPGAVSTIAAGVQGVGELVGNEDAGKDFAGAIINAQEFNPIASEAGTVAGVGASVVGAVVSGGGTLAAQAGMKGAVMAGALVGASAGGASAGDQAMLNYLAGKQAAEQVYSDVAVGLGVGTVIGGAAGAVGKKVGDFLTSKATSAAPALREGAEKVIEKADDALYKEGVSKITQEAAESRGVTEPLKIFVRDHNLVGKNAQEVKAVLKEPLQKAERVMNLAKEQMVDEILPPTAAAELKETVNELLKTKTGYQTGFTRNFIGFFNNQKSWTLDNLQQARTMLGKIAGAAASEARENPELVTGRPENLLNAYNLLNSAIKSMAENSNRSAYFIEQFVNASDTIHYGRLVQNGINVGTKGEPGLITKLIQGGAAVVGGVKGGLTGAYSAAKLAGGAVDAVEQAAGPIARAGAAKNLANAFLAVDEKMVKLIEFGGNNQKGIQQLGRLTTVLATKWDLVRDQLGMTKNEPNTALQDFYDQLAKQGISGPMADNLARKSLDAHQFLASKLPQTVRVEGLIQTETRPPSKQELNVFSEYFLAVTQPNEALDNPTPRTIEALKAVYPESYAKVVETINERINSGEALTPKYKKWASQVLGLASNKLAIPVNNAIMNAGVQAAEAAGRAPAPYAPTNRGSEMTQSQRLGAGINEE